MVGCSIRNCKSKSVKGSNIRFFRFPTKESVAKEWLRYCGPKTTTKYGRLCSNHFLLSDYFEPLQYRLLNISPTHVRKLKSDAIPTLGLDNTEEQNTPKVKIKGSYEILDTTENMNCLLQCNTIAANEVGGSSKVIEKRPIRVEQNTRNVTVKVENEIIMDSSENANCLPQCNIIAADEGAGSPEAIEERPIGDKQNTQKVTVKVENKILDSTENAGPSQAIEESAETITISLAEHKAFVRNTNKLQVLQNNLKKIFTSGQIRYLMNPNKRRIKWTAEDIAAAISLRSITPKGYRHLRDTVGFPLPGCSTLRRWVSKFEIQEVPLQNDVILINFKDKEF